MPKYIDLDKAIQDVESVGVYYNEGADVKEQCLLELEGQPIADVVPRSEVEKAKQEVAKQVIDEFKAMVIDYVQDRDLLLVAFKNAVAYAEAELKKKYIGKDTDVPTNIGE